MNQAEERYERVAIVIPCYNESATLGSIVSACRRFGTVIVVDDGSSDNSAEIARQHGGTVVRTTGRTGYDGAIEHGLRTAYSDGFQIIITIDADGEHDPKLVKDFIQAHDAGADLVIGIRPKPQRIAEWIVCLFCEYRFGVKDILCGMKGMTRSVLKLYLSEDHTNLVNTWPALLWRSKNGNLTQIDVTGTPRQDAPRFQSLIRANLKIAAMLFTISKLPKPRT
jgi:glycosyltransferase involved in cell wall biosynthesis